MPPNRTGIQLEDMALGIVIWFCVVPFILFLGLPLMGIRLSLLLSIGLLILVLLICRGICTWKLWQS